MLPTARGARLWGRFLAASIGVWLFLVFGAGTMSLTAQEDEMMAASREYRIKAAYLYQFGRYVEWPPKTFSTPQSPFVIGVLDGDPIAADLEQIARIKKIQDRPIQVRRFSTPDEVRACHILYLSASLPPETQAEIIRRMRRKGVLPVGESNDFLDWGGAIRFVVEENKVRVFIDRKAAEREGLTISAKLLQVAHVVD